ncbi:MAG TPA: hypothetical protein VKE22_17280 [Haliangiales bacterium]|nr:hypothetical protein [Haliangiales bacterium]
MLLVLLLALPARAADAPPDWKDLQPLLGAWTADPAPDGATGGFTLEPSLGGRVLVRKNRASYARTKDRPASVHDDLMVVYRDGAATRADYWDSEGHVIRYGVTVDAGKSIVFLSEGAGPRYRLTYSFTGAKAAKITFEIAPPDRPDAFKTYIEAGVHRVR